MRYFASLFTAPISMQFHLAPTEQSTVSTRSLQMSTETWEGIGEYQRSIFSSSVKDRKLSDAIIDDVEEIMRFCHMKLHKEDELKNSFWKYSNYFLLCWRSLSSLAARSSWNAIALFSPHRLQLVDGYSTAFPFLQSTAVVIIIFTDNHHLLIPSARTIPWLGFSIRNVFHWLWWRNGPNLSGCSRRERKRLSYFSSCCLLSSWWGDSRRMCFLGSI